jgi:hypothetical protein
MNSACSEAQIDRNPAQTRRTILQELAREFGFILHPATHTLHLSKEGIYSDEFVINFRPRAGSTCCGRSDRG